VSRVGCIVEYQGKPALRIKKGEAKMRNIQQIETTWGEWCATQSIVPDTYTAEAVKRGANDDTPIIAYKEVTPFGTFTHLLEWVGATK